MDGCTHISLLPCAHTEAGDTHRDLSPHCSLQEAPDALPAQLRVTQGSRHPGHSEHRKGEGSGIRGVSTDALLGAVHPRFPRGSPTGRGGAGGCPRASFHPGRPWHGQLGQAWLGPWGRVLLSCLWPLEQWLSPRRQVQAKDKGTWGGGHRSVPEMGPVGSGSHDTKLTGRQLQETGGTSAAGQATGAARLAPTTYTPPSGSVPPSALPERGCSRPPFSPEAPPRSSSRSARRPTQAQRQAGLGGLLSSLRGPAWLDTAQRRCPKTPTNLLAKPAAATGRPQTNGTPPTT